MDNVGVRAGLDGVVAAETRISGVDGQAGELIIAGFPLEELASKATFEEVAYLLWNDSLPNPEQLESFMHRLTEYRELPTITYDTLKAAAMDRTPPMDALRMAAGTLSRGSHDERPLDSRVEALILVARF